jgi:halimadienyl-diphosphate synthase
LLTHPNNAALAFLEVALQNEGTGAAPALRPIDTFDIAWSILHLRHSGAIHPGQPEVRRALDFLWETWSQEHGIGFSSFFSVPDVDDTAACFAALAWGGYPVDPAVFNHFESDDYFCCYHGETNVSLSAHARLLSALRLCEDHPRYPIWIEKTVNVLRRFDENGSFWWDKWHASPYYVNAAALNALYGVADDLAATRLKWIVRTQNDDGGWGYLGRSTPEETAYCLEALVRWDRDISPIEPTILDAAARYLQPHLGEARYTPLWIGKSLYTPHNPVKAAIAGALFSYGQRGQG